MLDSIVAMKAVRIALLCPMRVIAMEASNPHPKNISALRTWFLSCFGIVNHLGMYGVENTQTAVCKASTQREKAFAPANQCTGDLRVRSCSAIRPT